MNIAVNLKNIGWNKIEEKNNFINECFLLIASKHPEHEFIFISDKPFNKEIPFPKNIFFYSTGTEAKKNILWQLWYNYKLPATLRKIKADVLFNTDGICSLRTKIPQCLLIHDLSFEYSPNPAEKKMMQFYTRFTPPSLSKAKMIFSISEVVKNKIVKQYQTDETKISITSFGINKLFQPISYPEKERIKEKYTEGKEFFLFKGSLQDNNNLINLLKAFSFFKKRQKSNMQLAIIATAEATGDQFIENLRLYKYRNEVKLIKDLPAVESAKIMAAAYAFVYVPLYDDYAPALTEAMKCDVPVITADRASLHETCGEAALYANPENFESMAHAMMLIFKDESKRSELIEKGRNQSQQFNWHNTADLLWQAICKTVQL